MTIPTPLPERSKRPSPGCGSRTPPFGLHFSCQIHESRRNYMTTSSAKTATSARGILSGTTKRASQLVGSGIRWITYSFRATLVELQILYEKWPRKHKKEPSSNAGGASRQARLLDQRQHLRQLLRCDTRVATAVVLAICIGAMILIVSLPSRSQRS